MLRRFLDRCRRIVVATGKHIEHSPVLSVLADRCAVIPFGLDPGRFSITPEVRVRADRLQRRHGPFVLFVGRLVPYKGVRFLIEAMRGLSGQLLIVGDGPLRDELAARIAELHLTSRVHMLGPVEDQDEFLALFHACRVFALPSVTAAEAFGMVLLEAMACGKPLVTSRLRSGVVHVNQHGTNGLHAEPGDPGSLRRALGRVLDDDGLAARLGGAGRERFRSEFTLRSMIEAHVALYEAIRSTDPVAAT